MCWIGTTNNNLQTAAQNISVYKVVRRIDADNCQALYMNNKYVRTQDVTSFEISELDPSTVSASDCSVTIYRDETDINVYDNIVNRMQQTGTITTTEFNELTDATLPSVQYNANTKIGIGETSEQPNKFKYAFKLTHKISVSDYDGERTITNGFHSYINPISLIPSKDKKRVYVYSNNTLLDTIDNTPDLYLANFIMPIGSKFYQNAKGEVVSDKIGFVEYTGLKITNIDPSTVLHSDCGIVLYLDEDGSTAYYGTANRLEKGGIITPNEVEALTGKQFPSTHEETDMLEIESMDVHTFLPSDCGVMIYESEVGYAVYGQIADRLTQGGIITMQELKELLGVDPIPMHPDGYIDIGMSPLAMEDESEVELEMVFELTVIDKIDEIDLILGMGDSANQQDDFNLAFDLTRIS